MSRVLVAADFHLGHRNIHKYRNFESAEEHDALVKENYHKVVGKRDTIMLLGDICFTVDALNEIKTWPGYKILILGNHDLERVKIQNVVDTYDRVYALHNKKHCWLSHAPLHPDELRGKFCVHGHVHANTIPDPRYFNVSLENIGFTPIDFNDIVKTLTNRVEIDLTHEGE